MCTLWGKEAESFVDKGGCPGAVVAIKAARLTDYSSEFCFEHVFGLEPQLCVLVAVRSQRRSHVVGVPSFAHIVDIPIIILDRSLSVSNSSTLLINPDLKEAFELKGWYDKEGKESSETTITLRTGGAGGSSPSIYIGQIKVRRLKRLLERLPLLLSLSHFSPLIFALAPALITCVSCLVFCSGPEDWPTGWQDGEFYRHGHRVLHSKGEHALPGLSLSKLQ